MFERLFARQRRSILIDAAFRDISEMLRRSQAMLDLALAALATGEAAAVSVALAHLLFNVTGALIFYPLKPLRALPLGLARGLGNLAARSRPLAFAYVAIAFFVLLLLLLVLIGTLRGGAAHP